VQKSGAGNFVVDIVKPQKKNHMKRTLLFALSVMMSLKAVSQAWQATNLTSVTYLPIVAATHNNDMYATVFNGFTATLNKLNTGGTSWSAVTTPTTITVPRFIRSAGTRMYLSTVNSSVFSMLYYTTDGSTFIPDTVGLPHMSTGVSLIGQILYFKGKVIVAMAGEGYYLKDTGAAAWHSINAPTMFNAPGDPMTYYSDTLYGYDNTGTHTLYVSGDWGTTWTVRNANLPGDFATNMFVADDVTGRLYAAGSWGATPSYGVKYSDDHGFTWTDATNANAFIGLNYQGMQQKVTALYAHDPVVYIAMENNADNTAPDIVGSMTGLSNLAYDTTGLPAIGGAANGIGFFMHQGKLALNLNVLDVFIKGGPAAVSTTKAATVFSLYPNPATDVLHVVSQAGVRVQSIRITDMGGRTVLHQQGGMQQVDIRLLQPGIYVAELVAQDNTRTVQRFVKH